MTIVQRKNMTCHLNTTIKELYLFNEKDQKVKSDSQV